MGNLSNLLQEHVVSPLRGLGVPIDLRGVQAGLLLLPILVVVFAFLRAWWRKRDAMRDAGM